MLPLKHCNWLCCLAGIFPFRMEIDEEKGKVVRFPLSFLHTELWWFLATLIVQISYFYTSFTQIWPTIYKQLVITGHDSLTLIYGSFGIVFILLVISLIPRMMVFRMEDMRKAVESIYKADSEIEEISPQSCTTGSRFTLGSFINFACAFLWIVSLFPITVKIMAGKMACIIYLMVFQFFFMLQMGTWSVMHHVSYYSVAFRIGQLTSYLKTKEEPSKKQQEDAAQRSTLLDKLKTAHSIFNHVCRASRKLDSTFSTETLLVLICCFVLLTSCLLFLICDVSSSSGNIFGIDIRFAELIACLVVCVGVLVLLISVDLPVSQVAKLREVVMDLCGQTQDPIEKQEIMSFLAILSDTRLQTSAAGFFTIGMDLFPSFISSVATYLIILLQATAENDGNIFTNTTRSLLSPGA